MQLDAKLSDMKTATPRQNPTPKIHPLPILTPRNRPPPFQFKKLTPEEVQRKKNIKVSVGYLQKNGLGSQMSS